MLFQEEKTGRDQFAGKVALVTGSSSGIGRGTAEILGLRGATVLVTGRNVGEIENTVSTIREAGGTAYGAPMDIAKREEIEEFFQTFVAPHGLDILVANAGVSVGGPFLDNTPEDFKKLIDTDLLGTVYCIQQAARMMRAQGRGGSIVTVTSVNAYYCYPPSIFYSGIKAALECITRGLAVELAKDRIRVNCVALLLNLQKK